MGVEPATAAGLLNPVERSSAFFKFLLPFVQLLPHQHGGPDHQGLRRQGDPDLRPGRRARTHAEAAGPGQQVRLTDVLAFAGCPWGFKKY